MFCTSHTPFLPKSCNFLVRHCKCRQQSVTKTWAEESSLRHIVVCRRYQFEISGVGQYCTGFCGILVFVWSNTFLFLLSTPRGHQCNAVSISPSVLACYWCHIRYLQRYWRPSLLSYQWCDKIYTSLCLDVISTLMLQSQKHRHTC